MMVFRPKQRLRTSSGCSESHNSEVQCIRITVNVLLAHFSSILCRRKYMSVYPTHSIPIINPLHAKKQYICNCQHTNSGKVIKVIYINVDHDMFRPLLGHHQVYRCVLRCWIFFYIYGSIFSSHLTTRLCDYCLVVNSGLFTLWL